MRGQARVARGRDWRYYTCPVAEERSAIFGPDDQPIICPERSLRADEAEAAVLDAIARLSLPDEAIREAREELRRRLREPASSGSDKERAEAEAQLAGMPDHDKLLMFDRQREILLSMAENIERATPVQLGELVARLVERVEAADRRITRVVWTPPARPFFGAGEVIADDSGALFWCPQGDSNP